MNNPHKHAELIKAWADGAEIEYEERSRLWMPCPENKPSWSCYVTYRIKPEPKPDVVTYAHIGQVGVRGASVSITSEYNWNVGGRDSYTLPANAKLTFDVETHKLKSIELIG